MKGLSAPLTGVIGDEEKDGKAVAVDVGARQVIVRFQLSKFARAQALLVNLPPLVELRGEFRKRDALGDSLLGASPPQVLRKCGAAQQKQQHRDVAQAIFHLLEKT